MDVSSVYGANAYSSYSAKLSVTTATQSTDMGSLIASKISAAVETTNEETTTGDSIMDLYKEICSKYPDTSFRLEDMQATVQYEAVHGKNSCPYLGYNNSMNQVGTNFGEKSQKSIEIDVSVLKNAVNDPEYKERLLNKIDGTLDSYSRWVSDANEQGATNMCVGITDEGEGIQTYGVFSQVAFSTEEQIKAMWSENSAVEALMQKAQQMQDSLIEGYMQALTEHTIAEDAYTEVFDQIDSGTGAESIQA